MKKKDFWNSLQSLGVADLHEKARELSEELLKLRFRKASGQLEQGHRIRETKQKIAAVQTLINKLGQNGEVQAAQ